MSRAGQPAGGRLLVVRAPRGPLAVGEPIDLVVSMKNVSDTRLSLLLTRGDVPLALVRDSKGKPIARTKEGLRRYGPSWWLAYSAPSRFFGVLEPGQTRETVFPLTRYYVFSTPGTYTVLVAASSFGGLVAKPVVIQIGKAATPVGAQAGEVKTGEAGQKKGTSPVK